MVPLVINNIAINLKKVSYLKKENKTILFYFNNKTELVFNFRSEEIMNEIWSKALVMFYN